ATRALLEHLNAWGDVSTETCWEPACGEGHMVRVLAEGFRTAWASDVHPYGFVRDAGFLHDFVGMVPPPIPELADGPDWIVTNPPFRLASAFVRRGLEVARVGVALLVRTTFLEGVERHRTLF